MPGPKDGGTADEHAEEGQELHDETVDNNAEEAEAPDVSDESEQASEDVQAGEEAAEPEGKHEGDATEPSTSHDIDAIQETSAEQGHAGEEGEEGELEPSSVEATASSENSTLFITSVAPNIGRKQLYPLVSTVEGCNLVRLSLSEPMRSKNFIR